MDRKQYFGFDYVRAFMALSVVAWHVHLFGVSSIFDRNGFQAHAIDISDILNFHFLLLAVPVFMLVSIFLFLIKADLGPSYFIKRIKVIGSLYLFWNVLFFVVVTGGSLSSKPFESLVSSLIFIVRGGGSIYYYFFSLLALVVIAYLTRNLSNRINCVLLCLSIAIVWLMPQMAESIYSQYAPLLVAFYNPLNFVPYVFIAGLIAHRVNGAEYEIKSITVIIFVCLLVIPMIIISVYEWRSLPHLISFPWNGYAIPPYTRISVIIGSTIIFSLAFLIKKPAPAPIRFLSTNSLGIYCLHPFVLMAYKDFTGLAVGSPAYSIAQFVLVVLYSLIGCVLLGRILKIGVL